MYLVTVRDKFVLTWSWNKHRDLVLIQKALQDGGRRRTDALQLRRGKPEHVVEPGVRHGTGALLLSMSEDGYGTINQIRFLN